jgi:hypothetical protein
VTWRTFGEVIIDAALVKNGISAEYAHPQQSTAKKLFNDVQSSPERQAADGLMMARCSQSIKHMAVRRVKSEGFTIGN